jgi:hypothetical protein
MKLFALLIFVLFPYHLFSQNNPIYTGLRINDTVKVLDTKSNYKARFYIFTDLSSCYITNINIDRLYKMYGSQNEFVVFVAGAGVNDLESLRDIFKGNYKIVGDEYEIYKDYYKVKQLPLMLILDNRGKVYVWENVKHIDFDIDSTLKIITKSNKNEKKYDLSKVLKEIQRIKTKRNHKQILTSLFHDALFIKNNKNFILLNMRNPNFYIVDSAGNAIKRIINNQLDVIMSISWFNQDSIVMLYGFNAQGRAFQFYDVINDNLSDAINFHPKIRENYGHCAITGEDKYINCFDYSSDNALFKKNDTNCSLVRDKTGKLLSVFDTVDNIYSKYKLSTTFMVIFAYNDNKIYSIQRYTNKLKVWDLNLNLLTTLRLDLGEKYREIKSDLPNFGTPEMAAKYHNMVSAFWKILIDSQNNNILLYFENSTYPPGVYDFMSDKVKHEIIFNIYDKHGQKLNKEEIILPKATVPFYFDDNYIYTTETNGNKLEIVKYQFIEKQQSKP